MEGGIRRKVVPRGQFDYINYYVQRREPANATGSNYSYAAVAAINVQNQNELNWRNTKDTNQFGNGSVPFLGWQGVAYQNSLINPTFEFESPFYSVDRFYPGKRLDYTGVGTKVERVDLRIDSKGETFSAFDTFVAIGEDFQVFFFTGLPRMYYEANPPAV